MTSLPVKRGRSPAKIPATVFIIIIYPYLSGLLIFCVHNFLATLLVAGRGLNLDR